MRSPGAMLGDRQIGAKYRIPFRDEAFFDTTRAWLFKGTVFFNVFTLKIWAAWPYMLSVSLIRCKNEALKNMHLKSTIKCFKEVKIDKWPDLSDSFLPIDCCVRMVSLTILFSGNYSVIHVDRYLDSDYINFRNLCIPGCLLVHLNIIIQHRHQSSKIF